MEKYAVFCYNLNGYEKFHPITDPSPNCHYVYVTDDRSIVSDGVWDVKYADGLKGSVWDKCYQLRFNPFDWCDEEIVIRIDGSVMITKNLDKLVEKFEKGDENGDRYDMALMIHPGRNTMLDEYRAWVGYRSYPLEQAQKCLQYMARDGYDVKEYKNLIQGCFEICRRSSKIVNDWHRMTYAYLKMLDDSGCERVDQTIWSFLLAKYFQHAKIMLFDQRIYQSDFFQWCQHNTDIPFRKMDVKSMLEPYLFNKRVRNVIRPEDI